MYFSIWHIVLSNLHHGIKALSRYKVGIEVELENGTKKRIVVRAEIKNINSFKVLEKVFNYEYERYIKAIESREKLYVETRRWDDAKGIPTVIGRLF